MNKHHQKLIQLNDRRKALKNHLKTVPFQSKNYELLRKEIKEIKKKIFKTIGKL